ncbi:MULTISPECIES: PTS system mannose/fructose/sorbose family transporter subunit IID [Lactobacillus]|uniref:PTS system mannose/fructose/sorbose family transporter subunit IID n=1 Tax=Lactobacillus TaxID=1578 RepID=UPI001C69D444|nr:MULTISPECIES: PTS system mannose/fructose/sorbose family transporter subunit IID [Lactobacillus]MCX8722587.1 PTS system mannose/fructose/sorbose family transporter subunit IID [Lactobacillus sp. B4005]QYN56340.1 PTS system mannose/fructose/sorbose family transporter subunit IID [Lactobacillus panisapium]
MDKGMTQNIKVTKLDIIKAWAKWCLAVEVPVSFDRMQALAFSFSISHILKKVYQNNPEEYQKAMVRHVQMFNTNCDWGSIIHGITISLEEQRAQGNTKVTPEMIESLKVGLMGPLAGIGDSVDQGIVATIPLAIFVPLALKGAVWAAFVPGIIYLIWSYAWSYFLINQGYKLGRNSVMKLLKSGLLKRVIDVASIVGLFMIGCLSASYVKFPIALKAGGVSIQQVLDQILPGMLPFLLTMGMYFYIDKKGPKFIRILVATMILAIILTAIGVMA